MLFAVIVGACGLCFAFVLVPWVNRRFLKSGRTGYERLWSKPWVGLTALILGVALAVVIGH